MARWFSLGQLPTLPNWQAISDVAVTLLPALVSILSDKNIVVPELPDANMVYARPGFNIIATANSRDQGVNELSAALKRRFNYVHIPIVVDQKTEIAIVRDRSKELMERYKIPAKIEEPVLTVLATVFREDLSDRLAAWIVLLAGDGFLRLRESVDSVLVTRIVRQERWLRDRNARKLPSIGLDLTADHGGPSTIPRAGSPRGIR